MDYNDLKPGMVLYDPERPLSYLFIREVRTRFLSVIWLKTDIRGQMILAKQEILKSTWHSFNYRKQWAPHADLRQVIRFLFYKA